MFDQDNYLKPLDAWEIRRLHRVRPSLLEVNETIYILVKMYERT